MRFSQKLSNLELWFGELSSEEVHFVALMQVNVGDNRATGAAGRGGPSAAGATGPDAVDGKTQARRVDKISRKLFPTAFTVFNALYWTVYILPYSRQGGK